MKTLKALRPSPARHDFEQEAMKPGKFSSWLMASESLPLLFQASWFPAQTEISVVKVSSF
jgi:hypothetical protein